MRKIKIFGVSVEGEDEDIVALLHAYNNLKVKDETSKGDVESPPKGKWLRGAFEKKFRVFWSELQSKGFVSNKRAKRIFGKSFRSLNIMEAVENRDLHCTYEKRKGFRKDVCAPVRKQARQPRIDVSKRKHFDTYAKAVAIIRRDGFITCKELFKIFKEERVRIGFIQYVRRYEKDVRFLSRTGYHLDGRKHDLIKAATPAPRPSTTAELLLKDINDTVRDKKTHEFLIAIKQCLLDKGRVTALWRAIYCPRVEDWQAVLHAIVMRSKGLDVEGRLSVDVATNDLMLLR